jgi:hypothetical protein
LRSMKPNPSQRGAARFPMVVHGQKSRFFENFF